MNTSVGLDIGSHSIKLVELIREKTSVSLRAAGTVPTPPKALVSTLAADHEALAIAIKKLFADTGVSSREVNIALPESQVFTRVIEVPQLSSRELVSAIQWEAEQYIPLPLEQVNVDFTVLRDGKETGTNKMDVLLVAAPKALIEKYTNILELANITTVGAETEIIAASRALVRSTPTIKTVMVVSLGAQTTDLAILRSGVLAFTRSISAGGEAISRAVAQGLEFNLTQAEEFKKTYGVEGDKLEGKIVAATKPVMDTIVAEMKRAVSFYQEKYKNEQVETVLLSGGTARLPGIVVFIAGEMEIEAQLANPWIGIAKDPRFAVLDSEGSVFTVAVGLALR
ncbi:MAG: Type IV pilus assembly protein PilM [Candidatus Gottesmanbacteria bacterium GW2011_GWA2_47_9]|uniref:Type IV pilus assembly protein PilM n=2 Tax=Candidatus Gottesmaniibacteriota TaxID=1752720 RepID=A0A0G1XPQ6_9BACT|nr:MAG: Type IV pilus assembly protein PilM [Candidatus Gottesmanbacteria bacterium GW2011_GWA2_47_9]KKU96315.1 MAG: Type IV pilus assembly protein PilM [Candidatus Gottesmanbacteria bacterium GW2011_GWA1_48_13]